MGYTVTPTSFVNEFGEEVISYEDASVQSTYGREQMLADFNRDNFSFGGEDLFYETPDGQVHHRYGDLDPTIYERFEPDFVDDLDGEAYLRDADITYEDLNSFKNLVGGPDNYAQMIDWASRNLDRQSIAEFDAAIDSHDSEIIEAVIRDLYEQWSEQRYYDDGSSLYQDDEEDDEGDYNYDPTDVSDAFVAEIYEAVGGQSSYDQMLAWGADNLPESEIDSFDAIIDGGDEAAIAEAVSILFEMYLNY
jgi:hypothetical protein